MIKSMTGFGKGEAICGNKKFRVELRSLNSKQLDLSVKIPGKYRAAEAEVRNLVSRMLQRGKVECFVSYEAQVVETSVHINREAFKAYVEELRSVCGENGVVAEGDALLHSVEPYFSAQGIPVYFSETNLTRSIISLCLTSSTIPSQGRSPTSSISNSALLSALIFSSFSSSVFFIIARHSLSSERYS